MRGAIAGEGDRDRAANGERIGRTEGRGRHDRHRDSEETAKDMYVYPLRPDFRAVLGLAPGSGLGPLGLTGGLEAETPVHRQETPRARDGGSGACALAMCDVSRAAAPLPARLAQVDEIRS